jgi:hypothetical protein
MGTIKTSNDYPIKPDYYYIVDFRNYFRLKVYPVYFVNKKTAKRSLSKSVKELKIRKHKYQVVSGKELLGTEIPYVFIKSFYSAKYEYPEERVGKQQRKTYRTIVRRRLRRMGLLTLIKPKYSVKKVKRDQVRIKNNTQRVAMSPNTVAKVFRLERKPEKYYYIIINKEKTHVKGVLYKIEAYKLNVKNGELKKCIVNMRSTDILIPYLLTDIPKLIKHLPKYDSIIKQIRKKGYNGIY